MEKQPHVRFAVICASNQNRSMEAHHVLCNKGFIVDSYGTGSAVRLPGPAIDKPNIYNFGVPYEIIYNDLMQKDSQLYTQNGLLQMLDRNRKIKRAPQRFQEEVEKQFDVIITCEERCFDAVCQELGNRGGQHNRPVHVINIEIKDNHEDAAVGGRLILELSVLIENSKDLDDDMESTLEDFRSKTGSNILYSLCYY